MENSKPANPKAPHVLRVETGTGPMKMKAWPNLNPAAWPVGTTLDVKYESEGKEWEGRPFTEHTIKAARLNPTSSAVPSPGNAPIGPGPHLGMWEKEAFVALLAGHSSTEVIQTGIEARQAAKKIIATDLDAKLSESIDFLESQ